MTAVEFLRTTVTAQPPNAPAGGVIENTHQPRRLLTLSGASRAAFYRVMEGKAAVSPDMAVRLGKLSTMNPDLWLVCEPVSMRGRRATGCPRSIGHGVP